MTHTPTPWRVEQESTQIWNVIDEQDQTTYALGYPIVTCRTSPCSSWAKGPNVDEGEANAAFIVKAVNSHEKLVEALRLVRGIIVEASAVGFNYKDGDWAERLYASQGDTANALKDAGETL